MQNKRVALPKKIQSIVYGHQYAWLGHGVIAPSVIVHIGWAKNVAFKKFAIRVYDEISCILHISAQN